MIPIKNESESVDNCIAMFLILIGTKAQLIKMAPVMREMTARKVAYRFVLTGQHEETMADLISMFGLPSPEYLVSPEERDTKTKLFYWIFKLIYRTFASRKLWEDCEYCLVHGDTLSTLFGALAGRVHGLKVVHVEAGLRSYNWRHPFPEEIIRVCVTKLSHYYYCADEWAAKNVHHLVKRREENVQVVGANTLLDALRFAIDSNVNSSVDNDRYCVVSVHRFENLSSKSRFEFIMRCVERFSRHFDVKFVLHPATKLKLEQSGWFKKFEINEKIELLPRKNYTEFIGLLNGAAFLASDGGSNQEECSYMGLPCLLFRDATEREEGLGEEVVLSKLDDSIISRFLEEQVCKKQKRRFSKKPTSNATPSQTIVRHLSSLLVE